MGGRPDWAECAVTIRTYTARVGLPPGLDWDRFEDFEQFCRERIQVSRFKLYLDLVDGKLETESIAEARPHTDDVAHGFGSVNLHLNNGEGILVHVAIATQKGETTWYTFEGPSETVVEGLAQAWRKRVAKQPESRAEALTPSRCSSFRGGGETGAGSSPARAGSSTSPPGPMATVAKPVPCGADRRWSGRRGHHRWRRVSGASVVTFRTVTGSGNARSRVLTCTSEALALRKAPS